MTSVERSLEFALSPRLQNRVIRVDTNGTLRFLHHLPRPTLPPLHDLRCEIFSSPTHERDLKSKRKACYAIEATRTAGSIIGQPAKRRLLPQFSLIVLAAIWECAPNSNKNY